MGVRQSHVKPVTAIIDAFIGILQRLNHQIHMYLGIINATFPLLIHKDSKSAYDTMCNGFYMGH